MEIPKQWAITICTLQGYQSEVELQRPRIGYETSEKYRGNKRKDMITAVAFFCTVPCESAEMSVVC
jgi:hypothetical protein